jgi:chromosome segregation ATPase
MPKATNGTSELVDAAVAIEAGLSALEEIAVGLEKQKLDTEKGIQRAARQLHEATEHQEKLAEALRSLAVVMGGLQKRQQGAVDALAKHANAIKFRSERMTEHMQAYAQLGAKAATIAEMLGKMETHPGGAVTALSEVEGELGKIVDEAKRISDAAESENFTEIAREANALRQKLQSMRARLSAGKSS